MDIVAAQVVPEADTLLGNFSLRMRPRVASALGGLRTMVLGLFFFLVCSSLGAEGLKHRYYLLAEAGYEPMCVVDVHVNNEHVTTVEPEVKKQIIDITTYVVEGDNEVVFETEALPEEGDDSGTIDIQIGSGTYKDGKLNWEALSVHYSVSRAQVRKENKDIVTSTFKFKAS